jgi:ABC-type amino acid transport substrate-binding protein
MRRAKFLLAVSTLLMAVALFGACNPAKTGANHVAGAPASAFDRVQQSGVLRVGYFLFEPTVMHDEANKPYGLFVDVVEQLAKDLRWTVEYKQVDLKNFAAGLSVGDYDLSIGATFSSPSRASGAMFTEPLFYLGYTGVTSAANAQRFKTWSDVDQAGVRVAVKQGSAIGDYATRNFRNAEVLSLEQAGLGAPLAAVPAQADIGLMNQVTNFCYMRDNPNAGLVEVLADKPMEFTGVCWAVAPGDLRMLDFVNTAIKHYGDSGRLSEWMARYKIPYLYRAVNTYRFDIGTSNGEIKQ